MNLWRSLSCYQLKSLKLYLRIRHFSYVKFLLLGMPLIGTIIEVPACCWDTTLYEGRLGGPRWLCAHEYVLVCTLHFVDDIRIILVPSHEFWNNLHCTLEIKVAWILFRKLVLCFSFRQWSVIQLNSYWLYYFIDRPNVMEHLESTSIYDRSSWKVEWKSDFVLAEFLWRCAIFGRWFTMTHETSGV